MIDTQNPEVLEVVIDSISINFLPYAKLSNIMDKPTLRRQRFFETTEEYMDLVREFEANWEKDDHILRVCIAIRIMVHIANLPEQERKRHYAKFAVFFRESMRSINGILHGVLRKVDNELGLVEPFQAPRGWSCSICLTSGNSHLCFKTECGHYFHIGCAVEFTSPICPLCRQIM